jgi:hypothetical protein
MMEQNKSFQQYHNRQTRIEKKINCNALNATESLKIIDKWVATVGKCTLVRVNNINLEKG